MSKGRNKKRNKSERTGLTETFYYRNQREKDLVKEIAGIVRENTGLHYREYLRSCIIKVTQEVINDIKKHNEQAEAEAQSGEASNVEASSVEETSAENGDT